jgi:hypothetical protein
VAMMDWRRRSRESTQYLGARSGILQYEYECVWDLEYKPKTIEHKKLPDILFSIYDLYIANVADFVEERGD